MYTYFKVKDFRCFEELEFDDLALVNLIAGVNNVGKTALLEAILLHGGYDLETIINALRGFDLIDPTVGTWVEHHMNSLFNGFDISKEIGLVSKDAVGAYRSIRLRATGEILTIAEPRQESDATVVDESNIRYVNGESEGGFNSSGVATVLEFDHEEARSTYHMIMSGKTIRVEPMPPTPSFRTLFQSVRTPLSRSRQASRYGELVVSRKEDQVLRMLKIIEPRLQDIRSAKGVLHGDIGTSRLVPLPLMGGGMTRLADLAVNIANAPNGIVLVDEIENGLHHSIMSKVWKAIALAARQSNTQVFATTHSWECIRAAHEAFASEEEYDFRLHRLGWRDGRIGRVTYDKGTLAAALKHELEVR